MTPDGNLAKPAAALDAAAIERCVKRIAREIAERNRDANGKLALIGIVRRGASLAERIAAALHADASAAVEVGTLDISSYRDDGRGAPGDPRLLGRDIPFAIDGRRVILIDDVLYTGRTVRAAMNELFDYGRPALIRLAVLVDRGGHELPIRPDFCGMALDIGPQQNVQLRRNEQGLLTLTVV